MPGYIVIDTETSGLYIYKNPDGTPHPADAPDQPRMAELAIIFTDDDFNIEREYQAYIQPNGWHMTAEATKFNGLTDEFLQRHGVPVQMALAVYTQAILSGRAVVAYGAQFDCKCVRGEFRHEKLDDLFDQTLNTCAMQASMRLTPKVVKLDENGQPSGAGGYPKLSDVVAHFGLPPYKKHSALDDARVTADIAKRLKAAGVLAEPKVHRAKKHPNNQLAEV